MAKNETKRNDTRAEKGSKRSSRKTSSRAVDEISDLVQLMLENGLTELNVEDSRGKVSLKRGTGTGEPVQAAGFGPVAPASTQSSQQPPPPPAEHATEQLLEVTSPMVGTFYAAASPDSEPYVSVGSTVGEDTVVCIVEAMKVMNEIKAECTGTIAEICVKNAQPVEFGQPLFRVRPS